MISEERSAFLKVRQTIMHFPTETLRALEQIKSSKYSERLPFHKYTKIAWRETQANAFCTECRLPFFAANATKFLNFSKQCPIIAGNSSVKSLQVLAVFSSFTSENGGLAIDKTLWVELPAWHAYCCCTYA